MRAGSVVVVCRLRFVTDLPMAVTNVIMRHARPVCPMRAMFNMHRPIHDRPDRLTRIHECHALCHAHAVGCVKRQREREGEDEQQSGDSTHGAPILTHALRLQQTHGERPGWRKRLRTSEPPVNADLAIGREALGDTCEALSR